MIRLALFLSILSTSIFAQYKLGESYTVYINYPDYTIKASVVSDFKKIKTKDTLTYYWYASNKIFKTQGGFDGKLLNGPFSSFYLSSALKEKGVFKDGLKNGTWYYWLENGRTKKISNWKNGVLNGKTQEYDDKGKLKSIISFKNGLLHGEYIEYANDTILIKKKYKNGNEVFFKLKKNKTNSNPDKFTQNSTVSGESEPVSKKKFHLFKRKSNIEDTSKKNRNKKKETTIKENSKSSDVKKND